MPSRGWVAKVCATKIATSGRENIKTKWPPKQFFFGASAATLRSLFEYSIFVENENCDL